VIGAVQLAEERLVLGAHGVHGPALVALALGTSELPTRESTITTTPPEALFDLLFLARRVAYSLLLRGHGVLFGSGQFGETVLSGKLMRCGFFDSAE
jgi:hypothetical protein